MFRRLDDRERRVVTINVDGREFPAERGANLAAVLIEAGFGPFRTTPVSGSPRSPHCMMGVCFECLAEIDGVPNRQTCLETVREGMTIRPQAGAARVERP